MTSKIDLRLLFGLQPGIELEFILRRGFCPHQCPQRTLSASSAHSWSLSVSTFTLGGLIRLPRLLDRHLPPTLGCCLVWQGKWQTSQPQTQLSSAALPPRFSCGPSSLPVKGDGWRLHPSMCPGPYPPVSPSSLLRPHVEAARRPTGPSFKMDPESDHDSPPCSHHPGQDPSSSPLPGVPASAFAPPPSLYSGGGCPMTM